MDLNELFRRHQLALIAASQSRTSIGRNAAARSADEYAATINRIRPSQDRHHAVLSVRTLLGLSTIQL